MGRGSQTANRRTARRLAVAAVAMFGFGYALVPLYNVFCQVTGLGGKTGRIESASSMAVDSGRWVTVEFVGSVAQGLPWEFRPATATARVHPGQVASTTYYARNLSATTIVGRAVPSVTPNAAASHFKKIECFCFSEQKLESREEKVMPVRYVVSPDLPAEIRTVTLSYTFFNTNRAPAQGTEQGFAINGNAAQAGS